MARILVLYYSAYGHVEALAQAIAEGAEETGCQVDIRRVPELVPDEIAKGRGFKLDQDAPVAVISELADYDGIVIGTGTRFGRMSSQMASFLDQAGGLWTSGALIGKVGSAFSASGSQHGGQEATLLSIVTNMLHFGMTIVGLDYGFKGQMAHDEITGGTPYGITAVTGADGSRAVSTLERDGARYQGRRVGELARALFG